MKHISLSDNPLCNANGVCYITNAIYSLFIYSNKKYLIYRLFTNKSKAIVYKITFVMPPGSVSCYRHCRYYPSEACAGDDCDDATTNHSDSAKRHSRSSP